MEVQSSTLLAWIYLIPLDQAQLTPWLKVRWALNFMFVNFSLPPWIGNVTRTLSYLIRVAQLFLIFTRLLTFVSTKHGYLVFTEYPGLLMVNHSPELHLN